MNSLVFDIETDDLNATKIWCITTVDPETEEVRSYYNDSLPSGLKALRSTDKLIGHNILGFDIPVIKKLCDVDLSRKKIVDTLTISRLFNPVRDGGHSLKSWGYRLGLPKIDFKDFQNFSTDMVKYCERDTLLNKRVYDYLKLESKGFSPESVQLEQEIARIINEQRELGFLFDERAASILKAGLSDKLASVVDEVHKEFKPHTSYKTLRPVYTKEGCLSRLGEIEYAKPPRKTRLSPFEFTCMQTDGSVVRKEVIPFNLGSRKQIGEYLQEFGWKPTRLTPTGQPIVDEGTLKRIKDIPQAQLIAEFLMLQKRIALISSWIDAQEEDGRVRGFVNPNGTITGRMTHRNPNVAQVPSVSSLYGAECRACWVVPEGYSLLGVDASGLELRMLAHYMNDKEYINEILTGDIHTTNQRLAGLESRTQAKTFIYALIYGAGDKKLGAVVGGNRNDGRELRERFLTNLPALKELKDRVTRASTKGFIKALDGRKLFIRSQHAALNTLLQGGGSIAMKRALISLDNKIKASPNVDAGFVANIHDEWQIEVNEFHADMVGKWGVDSIREAGEHYKLNCPLDGEYKVGGNWNETH